MTEYLLDYYRLPEKLGEHLVGSSEPERSGFFRFGEQILCFGACSVKSASASYSQNLPNLLPEVRIENRKACLPFQPSEVIANLLREKYESRLRPASTGLSKKTWVRHCYYAVRELLPVSARRHLQRIYFRDWQQIPFPSWPVDFTVDNIHEKLLSLTMEAAGVSRIPFIWFWPNGSPSCVVLTHDVETASGRDFSSTLMDIDDKYGFKASFQVVPEKRYGVPDSYVQEIRDRGFEFNVHDLNHDGNLYQDRDEFLRRAKQINRYVHLYDSKGFRAGAMYRNLDWYDAFEFSYDMSVPNVAHLEPKRGGCCTVMPFFIGNILELPLTTAQDYSVFHILNDYSIDLWKEQIHLIKQRNGLISFISHPDYLIPARARKTFESLLGYLRQECDREKLWTALPREIDSWWRARRQMKLVCREDGWAIEGPQSESARIAFAVLKDGKLSYELPSKPS